MLGGCQVSADVHLRARSSLGRPHAGPSTAGLSRTHSLPAESAILEHAFLWAFVAGLAWCPFWFGSNVLLAWGINGVLFPGLVALYEVSLLLRGKRHPVAIKHIKVPAALFVAVVAWILIQNATWTPAWLHHPIWQMSADALDRPVDGSISVNRDLTTLALLRLITAASVFWFALQLCRDASRANLLLWSIAAIVCAYAAYGLVAFGLTPGSVLWFENRHSRDFVTSTFINPNSFAAYAGTGFVVICGLILRLYRHEFIPLKDQFDFRIATFIEVTGQKGLALLGGAFVVLVALLLSGSRGGIASSALGLFVLANTYAEAAQTTGLQSSARLSLLLARFLWRQLLWSSVMCLSGKLRGEGFRDESRMAVYRSRWDRSLTSLLGYGYGTFADVFPMFRDQSVNIRVSGKWPTIHIWKCFKDWACSLDRCW